MSEVVDTRLLEDVAGMKPSAVKDGHGNSFNPGRREFDLADWIATHEVPVRRESAWNGTGHRWVLEECPWNGHTDNAPFIVRWPDGTIGAGCHHNSCQGYGWRDLREHYEPGCYDKQGSGSDAYGHRGGDSPNPEPNGGSSLSQVTPFPTEVLPSTLRRFVEEAATSIGCPPEFIGVPMLATLGAAIGNSRVLEVKRDWHESASLYTAVVGDPGSSKTPALKIATAPAQKKQEELSREYREAFAEYNRVKRRWEVEGNGEFTAESPAEPVYRRNVVQDTTVEAFIEKLAQNPKGLLSNNDELSGWMRSHDQYKGGKGTDRQFWLSAWSSSSVSVDRKGRKDPLMVSRPFVGIVGGIQPGILSEIKNDREDGLTDRFLFAYPAPMSTRWSENETSEEAMAAYQGIYEELYGLSMGTDENGIPAPRRATFMPEAKQTFVDAYNSLHEEMGHIDFPAHLRGPWSKMDGYLARISLIIAMARLAEYTKGRQGEFWDLMKSEPMIGTKDVQAAIALVEYFKAHARRVYAKLNSHRKERTASAKGTTKVAGDDKQPKLSQYLVWFLRDRGGYWEGTASELYEMLKSDSVPGLPGAPNHLGRQVREIAADPNNEVVLAEGHPGKRHVVKLSLSTLGTVGDTHTETTEGTEGKTKGEKATADPSDPDADEIDPLAETKDAIERLFDEHPEFVKGPDPEAIAVELFYWDYLDYIPTEAEVREVLNLRTAYEDQTP